MLLREPRYLVITIALGLTLASSTLFAGNEKNYTYLALGDSVAFGLNPILLDPTQPPPSPSAFKGYPEFLADAAHLTMSKKEVNAACPGETSGSFVSGTVPDLGCYGPGPQGQPPFKTWIGLHNGYQGAQLAFAVSELMGNKHIDLVTLGVGANDILLLLGSCGADPNPPACVGAGLGGVLATYAGNLANILGNIRGTAGYQGRLVLVGFYAPQAALTPIAKALNDTTQLVGSSFGIIYVDGLKAFQDAAASSGGDVCKADLLIHLDANTCDIHPSPKGHAVLAQAVLAAIGSAH
jgi:lysophospholipase L1-like esterase